MTELTDRARSRDSTSRKKKKSAAATTDKARNYMRRRYRSLDQRLVNALESRIITGFIDDLTQSGDTVLDVPCGYGRFTEYCLARQLDVTVVDIKPAMLTVLQEQLGALPGYCASSDSLPFPDNSFDVSICIRLMQHLHRPEQRRATLSELARVSRNGVVVTVYDQSRLHTFIHRSRKLKRLHRYTDAELNDDLNNAGLRIVESRRPLPGLHAQRVLKLAPR